MPSMQNYEMSSNNGLAGSGQSPGGDEPVAGRIADCVPAPLSRCFQNGKARCGRIQGRANVA